MWYRIQIVGYRPDHRTTTSPFEVRHNFFRHRSSNGLPALTTQIWNGPCRLTDCYFGPSRFRHRPLLPTRTCGGFSLPPGVFHCFERRYATPFHRVRTRVKISVVLYSRKFSFIPFSSTPIISHRFRAVSRLSKSIYYYNIFRYPSFFSPPPLTIIILLIVRLSSRGRKVVII